MVYLHDTFFLPSLFYVKLFRFVCSLTFLKELNSSCSALLNGEYSFDLFSLQSYAKQKDFQRLVSGTHQPRFNANNAAVKVILITGVRCLTQSFCYSNRSYFENNQNVHLARPSQMVNVILIMYLSKN